MTTAPAAITAPEQAQAAPAEPTASPVTSTEASPTPPQAPVDPSAAAEALFNARREGASAEEIETLRSQLYGTPPAPEAPAPAAETPDPAQPAAAATNEPAEAPEPEEGAQPPEGSEPKKDSERFRFKAEEDQIVARIAKTKGISLVDAARLYAGEPSAPKAEASPTAEPAPAPVAPAVTALEAEIAGHRADLEKIKEERKTYQADPAYFADDMAELEARRDEILAGLATASGRLEVARLNAQQAATQAAQTEQTQAQLEAARDRLFTETAEKHPEIADKTSPLWAVMHAVSQEIADPAHPDHAKSTAVDALTYCLEVAHRRLGVRPAAAAQQPAATQAPARAPGPASSSRSTLPPPPVKSAAQIAAEAEARFRASRNAGATEGQGEFLSRR